MKVLDGTQFPQHAGGPPMPSEVDDGDLGDFQGPAKPAATQCRFIAGGPAADDHDAGCHRLKPSQGDR